MHRAATVVLIVLAITLALLATARGQSARGGRMIDPGGEVGERSVQPAQEETDGALSPAITFITASVPYCYQPDPAEDLCLINVRLIDVLAQPATYMRALTMTIDDRVVGIYRGFFDERIKVPFGMNGEGFRVACGAAGVEGEPNAGHIYELRMVARDSNNSTASNYGQVRCPPYSP